MDATALALTERIFLTVFPLFAIVLCGYLYGRYKKPDMALANQLNMDIFVPALIFFVLSDKSFDLVKYQSLAMGAAIVILGSGLLLWPACRLLKIQAKTFLPPMMFSNSGNLGLPLIILAFGEHALPAAIMLFIVEMTLHFTVGIYMMDHKTNPFRLLRMPIIIATIAGLSWSSFSLTVPPFIATSLDMLGQISIPLLLFTLGVRLITVDFSSWRIGVTGAILCPAAGILIALAAQQLLQLQAEQYAYLIIFGALPPAVLNYIVAEQYNQEPRQVASIVLLGNMGALFFIPATLVFVL
ncbi:AEC family transporter [Amphritea balenae]|uniref:AEC family transporter n=1 Tax=Amphritea balenae TaxID=452629 RepID=A0A3P1SKC5_9GAMM|nr:AEC family transporter [Amphritea balenae]RRC97536.1 AEC family transporter [Amphritea balenae]GGK74292.1 transporter [Amphritea balenae]